jgi:hypothetical protein
MKVAHLLAVLVDGNNIAWSPGLPRVLTMSSAKATMSLWMKKLGHETMVSVAKPIESA